MNYRAIFIGGPLDGQERVTQQTVSEIYVRGPRGLRFDKMESTVWRYTLLFAYGDNTIVYSTLDASEALDLVLEYYMKEDDEAIL